MLTLLQSKIPVVEAQLSQELEAFGQAERAIANTDAQMEAFKQDSELEIDHLKKKLEDVESHLKVLIPLLRDFSLYYVL